MGEGGEAHVKWINAGIGKDGAHCPRKSIPPWRQRFLGLYGHGSKTVDFDGGGGLLREGREKLLCEPRGGFSMVRTAGSGNHDFG